MSPDQRQRHTALVVFVTVMAAMQALSLWRLGHPWISTSGKFELWHGEVFSSENSQQLTDWYTLGHINHGILAYGFLWLVARRLPWTWRLGIAAVSSFLWEVIENTDAVINRFRAVTISLDYYGDSVLNSVADTLAMTAGFLLARVLPVWVSVAIVLGTEALSTWMVRDGLFLNALMLTFPIEAVKDWQMQGWEGGM